MPMAKGSRPFRPFRACRTAHCYFLFFTFFLSWWVDRQAGPFFPKSPHFSDGSSQGKSFMVPSMLSWITLPSKPAVYYNPAGTIYE